MLRDKTILVTGGTGSLGQAFVTLALAYRPKVIRIYSRNENHQVEMARQFAEFSNIRFFIGDVRDRDRLDAIMSGVDFVIHTAALKHVSVGEHNPQELAKTNIMGAINVIDISAKHKVKKILAISSDKAVYPLNAYGASKALMEKLFRDANLWSSPETIFSCIRSGNFWGSSGSVIPLWQEQSKMGEITLTDSEMTRYWITLPEIAQFTIQCLDMMKGGEIFVPKMVKKTMGQLLAELYPNVKVRITGRGEGEKLTESLFSEGEKIEEHNGYYVVR